MDNRPGMSFKDVADIVGPLSSKAEQNLNAIMNLMNSQEEPSTADLIKFQAAMKRWTLAHDLESTIVKELGDTLKGIVQKAP